MYMTISNAPCSVVHVFTHAHPSRIKKNPAAVYAILQCTAFKMATITRCFLKLRTISGNAGLRNYSYSSKLLKSNASTWNKEIGGSFCKWQKEATNAALFYKCRFYCTRSQLYSYDIEDKYGRNFQANVKNNGRTHVWSRNVLGLNSNLFQKVQNASGCSVSKTFQSCSHTGRFLHTSSSERTKLNRPPFFEPAQSGGKDMDADKIAAQEQAAWMVRLANENGYLSYCRNVYIATVCIITVHLQDVIPFCKDLSLLFFIMASLNLATGTTGYIYNLLALRRKILMSSVTVLVHITLALLHFLMWLSAIGIYLGIILNVQDERSEEDNGHVVAHSDDAYIIEISKGPKT